MTKTEPDKNNNAAWTFTDVRKRRGLNRRTGRGKEIMRNTILNTGALGIFSACPQGGGNLLRATGGASFADALSALQAVAGHPTEAGETVSGGTDLLRALSGYAPLPAFEPESFTDSGDYAEYLATKFGMRVTAKYFKKDQESMDALGRGMSGNDLVVAPNILQEMATDRDKAAYYEAKIQYWFDNIPKWKAESAAMGLTYEPCGVAIHEDGTVYYIGGGTETPERQAQIEAAQKAKREKKFQRRREQQAYIQALMQQKQVEALTANWASLAAPAAVIVTTKKILPDGSIYITTKKDGKIVERTTKKPHLVPVLDATAEGGVKMEPMQDIFALLMM